VIKVVDPICSKCDGDLAFCRIDTKKYTSFCMFMDMHGSSADIAIGYEYPDDYRETWDYALDCEHCGYSFKGYEYEELYRYNINRNMIVMGLKAERDQKAGSSGVGSSHDSVIVASTSSTSDESSSPVESSDSSGST